MFRRWLSILLPLLVLSSAVYMRLEDPQIVQELRLKVFDNYQKIKPRTFNSEETPARIVDIDEASLKKFGQWPWPRPLLASLLERLSNAGAAIVVFDVVFAEPDRTSPSNLVKEWMSLSDDENIKKFSSLGTRLPDHDQLFASAIGQSAVI